jgi:oligogalacturonide lyase
VFPSAITHYPDPATEFPVNRLTDPQHTSLLPAYPNRTIARNGNFLLYASDMTGRFEAFRLDLKSGQSKQLTEAAQLDPHSLVLLPDERGFCYVDEGRLFTAGLSNLHARPVGSAENIRALNVADDGLYAAVIQEEKSHYRLTLVQMSTGAATTLAEADEELRDPVPRPRRASVLYYQGSSVKLANYDGQQNYRLRLADGEPGPAAWSPDGRAVLYLDYPPDPKKLNNIREFTPDTNEDKLVSNTSQFVQFARNSDASVFVGASGSKASPYVLLLVRAAKRELTIAEHRASDPRMVAPRFAPNSQRVYFASDRHGKPAIYSMTVDKLVSETEGPNEGR